MSILGGWRPLFRLAWRDAWRHKGRSALAILLIALPVLAVTTADVLITTSDVSGAESLDRRIGAADAGVTFEQPRTTVEQLFDPDQGLTGGRRIKNPPPPTLATVSEALGRDVPGTEVVEGSASVVTDNGRATVQVTQADLTDPLTRGLATLQQGRFAATDAEVAISPALADKGFSIGDDLELAGGTTRTVVGIATWPYGKSQPMVWGKSGLLSPDQYAGTPQLLIGGGPVSWDDVRTLNKVGALVTSRAVLTDPPPESELPADLQGWNSEASAEWLAIVALVVTMALVEVVLLAGPAFAVGARRQARSLALVSASGGTPQQSRRAVLASGVVLGGVAAVTGVGIGLLAALALLPVVAHFSDSELGPFDVRWLHVAGIAAFALVSALLAAMVPAWIASRQDVVAVLAGRRGDPPPSKRSPVLGIVLLAAGTVGSAMGAVRPGNSGTFLIAASAVVAVLGGILLTPLVVALVSRLARSLPLPLRFAARDAGRHRTRTVPAIAAVMATVAGVVALGVANASDQEEYARTYLPSLADGKGVVWASDATPRQWRQLQDVVEAKAPQTEPEAVQGLPSYSMTQDSLSLTVRPRPVLSGWNTSLGGQDLVATSVPDGLPGVSATDRARGDRMLARGGIVLFADAAQPDADVKVRVERTPAGGGRSTRSDAVSTPAAFVEVRGGMGPAQSIASPELIRRLGVEPSTVGLYLGGQDLTKGQEGDLAEALNASSDMATLYVERGWNADNETLILFGILFGLGAILMLGGTLTATFLALSDARPDLATLAAVGASPRSRRGVAASYALVIGLVGAVLGVLIGMVPGVAASYPLTGNTWSTEDAQGNALPTHYLDIPWLLIGALVVVLPLVVAGIVWLSTRSRLPMVARLD